MSLGAALSIASSQIGNLNAQIALVSQNIANATTPGYAVEDVAQHSLTAGGIGLGAANGAVQRAVDAQGQAAVLAQNADVASLQTRQAALAQIDAAQGAVGSGTDLGSLLGAMGNAFSALAVDPSNQTQQARVVAAASALAGQINSVGSAIASTRQAAQDAIGSGVGSLNTTLATLGTLSDQIVQGRAAGLSTADLENQRAAAMDRLSTLVAVKFHEQPNGDLLAITASGLNLPLHGTASPFSSAPANTAPGVYAPGGGLPGILLGGQDVTAQLTGGQLGGNITLRDATLPQMQANLDEFAFTLANRFDAQGLTLFTDASGTVPAAAGPPAQAGYIGFAQAIQVNPSVAASPALVRDGTHAVASGGGASAFTPNPPGGPAGFSDMITRVLQYALGGQVASGVAQPPPAVSGLGPSGALSSGYAAPSDLTGLATAVTGSQAQASEAVTQQLTTAQGVQTTLQTAFAANTSVSIDAEMAKMVALQNAYGANARVLSAVQSMWSQLLQTVQ